MTAVRIPLVGRRHPFETWMILSGSAGLAYELVLQKLFSYILGGSLLSTTITISAYMAGLSLGSFLFGRIADIFDSARASFRLYAVLELGIGVLGLGSLIVYAVAARSLGPSWLHLFAGGSPVQRSIISFVALLPITTLLGGTFPALGKVLFLNRALAIPVSGPQTSIRALYAANLLGALTGTALTAYVLLPPFGLWGATSAACVVNLVVAAAALRMSRRFEPSVHDPVVTPPAQKFGGLTRPGFEYVTLGFLSGLVLFALEIVWTHLLAAVIGSSVYAFANMLIAVLVGLFVAARNEGRAALRPSLENLILKSAIRLALSIPAIALASFVFAIAGLFDPGFLLREITRLGIALLLIVPVASVLSSIYPRLLTEVEVQQRSSIVGSLNSVNTVGCVAGLLLSRFVLVPMAGSLLTLRLIVAVLLLASVRLAMRNQSLRSVLSILPGMTRRQTVIAVAAIVALCVPSWRPSWLLSGRNIYFSVKSDGDFYDMLYLAEDAESGFVTVHRSAKGVNELRTNGKFEGNNSGEMIAQVSFAYLPSLISKRMDNAFLIGLGTGATLKGLADFPFTNIDVAERSVPMVTAARTYFREVNGDVADDPRVRIIHDDGRNALAMSDRKYDVVSIEITSIWFAGAADLYSRDFYKIVNLHLTSGGVFQQWVQLHHMRLQDLWVILNTVRSEFPHVALWYSGGQGQIIASRDPLTVDWERMRRRKNREGRGLTMTNGTLFKMVGGLLLDEAGVDQFLAKVSDVTGPRVASMFASSDLWPYLEYATPKGNALDLADRLNIFYLREFIGRNTAVPLRGTDVDRGKRDPILTAAESYFSQRCDDAAARAAALAPDEAAEFDVFRTCTPWLSVPSTLREAAHTAFKGAAK